MFLKLATSSKELTEIVNLRKRVFVDELNIQDKDYQDVFNDYFCKNLMVMQNEQLVGAMRVAFDRHTQRFYASYFVTASSKRNRTTGVLLVGGMLRIIEANGIQTLYADSHQQILQEYLNFGCEIIGKPYRKYGFNCDWTPIRYQFSLCTSAGQWMLERVRPFLSKQQCQWKYPVQLILCRTIGEYETVLERLMTTRQIFAQFPIIDEKVPSSFNNSAFIGVESIQAQSAQVWLESQSYSLNGDEQSSFEPFNKLIPQRRVLAIRRNSPLVPMAKCYAMLTGKHLQMVDHFSKLVIDQETESVWVWMMATDSSWDEWEIIRQQSRKVAVGLQISQTVQECSINLVRNYLDFIQPQTQPVVFDNKKLILARQNYHQFASFGNSHLIISKEEYTLGSPEQNFCQELLENGFSFVDAVKRLNLEFSSSFSPQPFLLIGDPALHILTKSDVRSCPNLTSQEEKSEFVVATKIS